MRSPWLLMTALALSLACNGKKDAEDTAEEVVPTDFGATPAAAAGEVVLGVPTDETLAWEALTTLWAATAISSTDVAIQGLMANNAPPPSPPPAGGARGTPCWEVQGAFPASKSVVFDTPCAGLEVYGRVNIDDLPSGPMRMVFTAPVAGEDFEIGRRDVLGALRFAPSGDARWTIGGGDPASADPGPDPAVVINGVTVPLALSARGQGLFGSGQLAFWGEVTAGTPGGDKSFYFGATTADQAASLASSPAYSRYDFFPSACKCSVAGSTTFPEITATITELIVDLDDLKATDDGRDDPAIALAVSLPLTGALLLAPSGERCSSFVAQFSTETTELTVPGQVLVDAVADACTFRDITDADACASLEAGAALVSTLTISVDGLLDAAIATAFEANLDQRWCEWPLPE